MVKQKAKTLSATVVVNDDNGQPQTFLKGTTPPAWAVKKITNTDVWDTGDSADATPAPTPTGDFDVADSTIDEVIEWVGDDDARRAYALGAERDRGDDARKTLIDKLEPSAA